MDWNFEFSEVNWKEKRADRTDLSQPFQVETFNNPL